MKALIIHTDQELTQPIVGQLFDKPGTVVKVGETTTSEGTEIPGVISLKILAHHDKALRNIGVYKFELEVEVYITSQLPQNAKQINPSKLPCAKLLLALEGDTSRTTAFGVAQRLKNVDSRFSNPDIALLAGMTEQFWLHVHYDKMNTVTLFGICELAIRDKEPDAAQAS